MLPKTEKLKLLKNNFPTRWQEVLYRNYGFVPDENLCRVLDMTISELKAEAARLGLEGIEYNPEWMKSGYLTIIKNNWHLLDYGQLTELLGWDEKRLDYVLKEEDFLYVKVGYVKPQCEHVSYSPLGEAEIRETARAAEILNSAGKKEADVFGFLDFDADNVRTGPMKEGVRIIHGYITPCGDTFGVDSSNYLSDALLKKYAASGVNGLWLHALLTDLAPNPFKDFGNKYVEHRKNLKKLIDRCAAYGIKVYLYCNEPRCMSECDFEGLEDIKGTVVGGFASLCMSEQRVRDYLYDSFYGLFSEFKELGGVITITMSENLTHCHSLKECNCLKCANKKAYEQAAEVNNIIMKAIRDSGSGGELIANLWGWSSWLDWTIEDTKNGVALLDRDISVLCVSEYDLDIEKGGVRSKIIDYSISNPGPSEATETTLDFARKAGHKVYAKVQVNNSWECSAVPYLPVFDLVYEHLKNLAEIQVHNYMLSWTLGGWPSPTLDLVSNFGKDFSLDEWYEKTFGENACKIHDAVKCICNAFRHYPFSIYSLYYSPKTHGFANMWEFEKQDKVSAMVSYSFDDIENWMKPYPYEVYISEYEKLLEGWEKGVKLLGEIKGDKAAEELWLYAAVAYCQFLADYEQTRFCFLKRNLKENADKIAEILEESERATAKLIDLQRRDVKIGYEASNHYFFTTRLLKEKLLNLQNLKRELKMICR